jgi:RND family efflux transporter MFP subunit
MMSTLSTFQLFMHQRLRPRLTTPFGILLLGLAPFAVACGAEQPAQGGGQGAPPGGAPPAVPVELVTLEPRQVEQLGEFVGTLKSRRSTTIQPQAEGFITRILVTSGRRVSPGTVLFEIDATAPRAALSSIEAQRAAREADVAFARQQAERAKTLLDAGAMSRQEHDLAATQLKTAEAQLKSIEDQIRQHQAELAYYSVVAPTAGIVGDIPVRVGDRVTRATTLTTVEDNAGLEAYINVPVQEASHLQTGLPVRLVDDDGQVLASSKVSFVAPSVDQATQTVLIKAPVGAGAPLRADQFVRAQVVWGAEQGLTLPVVAAQRINGRYFAFVAEGGEGSLVARQRPVTLGPIIDDAYVLLDGLKAGDRLILAGTQKIADGAPVQVLPPAPPAGAAPAQGGGSGGA